MSQYRDRREQQGMNHPSDDDLRMIVTDPDGAETLVRWAENLGQYLKNAGLATNQIRSLFGEVRQIQAEWSIESRHDHARRRLILLKPKMAYRARKERGKAVEELVSVLRPAVDLVTKGDRRKTDQPRGSANTMEDNFDRFVEFFEAILAYHKAYGGN